MNWKICDDLIILEFDFPLVRTDIFKISTNFVIIFSPLQIKEAVTEAYLEPTQTSKLERFVKIVNGF